MKLVNLIAEGLKQLRWQWKVVAVCESHIGRRHFIYWNTSKWSFSAYHAVVPARARVVRPINSFACDLAMKLWNFKLFDIESTALIGILCLKLCARLLKSASLRFQPVCPQLSSTVTCELYPQSKLYYSAIQIYYKSFLHYNCGVWCVTMLMCR